MSCLKGNGRWKPNCIKVFRFYFFNPFLMTAFSLINSVFISSRFSANFVSNCFWNFIWIDLSKLSKISFVIFRTATSFDEARAVTFLGRSVIKDISPNIEPISNSLTTISSESVREIRLLSILLLTSLESFIFPCRIMNNQDSIAPCFIMISSALYFSNSPLEFIRQDFSSSEKCSKKGNL